MQVTANVDIVKTFNKSEWRVDYQTEVKVLGSTLAFWNEAKEKRVHNVTLTEAEKMARKAYLVAVDKAEDFEATRTCRVCMGLKGDYRDDLELIDTKDVDGKVYGRIVTRNCNNGAQNGSSRAFVLDEQARKTLREFLNNQTDEERAAEVEAGRKAMSDAAWDVQNRQVAGEDRNGEGLY